MKHLPRRLCLAAAVLLFAALPQARAQVGVYATYGGSNLNQAYSDWASGPTFGVYLDALRFPAVRLGLDLRGTSMSTGSSDFQSGLIGPRIAFHVPVLSLNPYAEALTGAAHVRSGQGVAYSSDTHGEYGLVLGLDHTILPRVDWRVIDFTYTKFTGLVSQKSISTGLVIRLPIR